MAASSSAPATAASSSSAASSSGALAIEVQHAMVERNAESRPTGGSNFASAFTRRVVEESDGDLMGDGVNIAARLEGVCEPGAICLSEDAYRQVKGGSI